jgi:hypothetical protein
MNARKRLNPFYLLLVIAGLAFVVTAFAYGFMAFQQVNAIRAEAARNADHPLFQWLRVNGNRALLIELAVLAVLTVAAIATDRLWDQSQRARDEFDQLASRK